MNTPQLCCENIHPRRTKKYPADAAGGGRCYGSGSLLRGFFYIFILMILFLRLPAISQEDKRDEIFSGLLSGRVEIETVSLKFIEKNRPPEFVPRLVKVILGDRSYLKKDVALRALRLYPRESVLMSWLEILEKTGSLNLQKEIIDYLSDLNDRRAVMPFAAQLKSPYHVVRESAASALKSIGDDRMYPFILEMTTSTVPVHKIYAIEALFFLYDRRFFPLVSGMLNDENKSVRIYALRCVRKNHLLDAVHLIRNAALGDKNTEVRVNAIEIIGDFRDFNSLYVLFATIGDQARDIRFETVKSLQKIGSQNSVYPVSAQLLAETEDDIKERMLDILINFRMPGDIRALEKVALTDKNLNLRIKGAFALGLVNDPRAVNILLKTADDQNFKIRAEACNSLGNYRAKLVSDGLLDVINREIEQYVRSSALYSLKRIDDKKTVLPLFDLYASEKDPVFREMVRRVLRYYIERYM